MAVDVVFIQIVVVFFCFCSLHFRFTLTQVSVSRLIIVHDSPQEKNPKPPQNGLHFLFPVFNKPACTDIILYFDGEVILPFRQTRCVMIYL